MTFTLTNMNFPKNGLRVLKSVINNIIYRYINISINNIFGGWSEILSLIWIQCKPSEVFRIGQTAVRYEKGAKFFFSIWIVNNLLPATTQLFKHIALTQDTLACKRWRLRHYYYHQEGLEPHRTLDWGAQKGWEVESKKQAFSWIFIINWTYQVFTRVRFRDMFSCSFVLGFENGDGGLD